MNASQWKKYLAAATLAVCIGGAGAALAAPSDMQGGPDPEVRAKAEKIYRDHRAATDATRQQLMVKEAELKGQMQSVNPDTSRIEALSREIGELRGRLMAAKVQMRQQMEKEGIPAYHHRGPGKWRGGEDCPGMDGGMGKHGRMKHDGMGKGHGGHKGAY